MDPQSLPKAVSEKLPDNIDIFFGIFSILIFLLAATFSAITFSSPNEAVKIILFLFVIIITAATFAVVFTIKTKYSKIAQESDILKKDTDNLVTQKNQLESILSSTQEGMLITDLNGNVSYLNEKAQKILNMDASSIKNHHIKSILNIDDLMGKIVRNFAVNLESVNGQNQIIKINSFPLISQGNLKGTIYLLFDVTEEEELEKMKQDFISQSAHQLRTPLTVLNGYLSVLKDSVSTKLDNGEIELLDKALAGSDQLINLTQSILGVSVIESGRLKINPAPVSIEAIIIEAINKLALSAQQKGIKFNLYKPNIQLPQMMLDPYLISEALISILSNSIEFSPNNSEVAVAVSFEPQNLSITITDHGEGIPSDVMSHLFSKFFKISDRLTQKTKGIGLGLYNAKAIIEAHHGKISVNSVIGRGASFNISFPIMTNQNSTGLPKSA